ncbi:manganese and iron superoxide dismutase [Ramicandelaber brevisporus]|nr:manganese and iron superoxide dismutase [Ramicandelaber brevisporus]
MISTLSRVSKTPAAATATASLARFGNQLPRSRQLHELAPLKFPVENGLLPLFSSSTLSFLHNTYQQSLIANINRLTADTQLEEYPVFRIMLHTAPQPRRAALFNNAAQAWNYGFFLNTLKPNKTGADMATAAANAPNFAIERRIAEDFGSFETFKKAFGERAAQLNGSGWVWLVMDNNKKLHIMTTYNAGNPKTSGKLGNEVQAKSQSKPKASLTLPYVPEVLPTAGVAPGTYEPILALSMWEHAYLGDHGLDKAKYVNSFWKVVDWDVVHKRIFRK